MTGHRLTPLAAFVVMLSPLTTVPAPAQETLVPQLGVEVYQLDNGLKVALCPDDSTPRTTVCVAYHVGSKNERAGLTGFAHFFEHMMFRGTRNVPNFDVPLQEAGGSPNAFTTEDVTVYFETIPNSYLQRALYMEAERMAFLPSALDPQKFDTEREIVKNERRQRMENVPYGLADETISSFVYPKGHPYSWSVIGTMQDLDNATLDDLRQFFYEFYHPGNATLTVVGNFETKQTKQWIEEYFGVIAEGPEIPRVVAPPSPPVAQQVEQKDQVQFPRVYWTWPTVAENDPDAPALDLLASILTDGEASRLYQALLVQRQVATDVEAQSLTAELAGTFTIYATVAPESSQAEVERLLGEQLESIRATAPAAEELARAQAKHEINMLRSLTMPERRAFAVSTGLAQYNDAHHYQRLFRDYAQVQPADLQRVAQKYLGADRFVLTIVPTAEGEEESPAVLAGPLADTPARAALAARPPRPGTRWDTLPAPAAERDVSLPKIEKHVLENGLEVWFAPWRTLPIVSVRLMIPAGSADDPSGQEGLANLTSRAWDKGTQDLTAAELAAALDALGVALGIGMASDSTQMSFTTGAARLDEVLSLVGRVLTSPRFEAADIDRERTLMLSDLKQGPSNPSWIAGRVFPRLLYGAEHPYGTPASGFETTLPQLSGDAVRAFYASHFLPKGSTLIVVGDVDSKAVLSSLEKHWGGWRGSVAAPQRPALRRTAEPGAVYLADRPGAVQSVVTVGRTWRDRHDDSYFAAQIGNRALGGDFLSRINQNLRERNGYTYGAGSGLRFRRTGSDWIVGTSVRADVTGAALRELVKELDGPLGERPLEDSEFEVARYAELNTFPEAFATPGAITEALAEMATYQLPLDYLANVQRQLQATTLEQTNRVLRQLATREERIILVVGDRAAVESQLREAGFTDIRPIDSDGK